MRGNPGIRADRRDRGPEGPLRRVFGKTAVEIRGGGGCNGFDMPQ